MLLLGAHLTDCRAALVGATTVLCASPHVAMEDVHK